MALGGIYYNIMLWQVLNKSALNLKEYHAIFFFIKIIGIMREITSEIYNYSVISDANALRQPFFIAAFILIAVVCVVAGQAR